LKEDEVEVEEMRVQMIVESVEMSWEFDVEELSRSYSFLRAPEDREKKQGCIRYIQVDLDHVCSAEPGLAAKQKSCRQ
jgi:hypothetical protein